MSQQSPSGLLQLITWAKENSLFDALSAISSIGAMVIAGAALRISLITRREMHAAEEPGFEITTTKDEVGGPDWFVLKLIIENRLASTIIIEAIEIKRPRFAKLTGLYKKEVSPSGGSTPADRTSDGMTRGVKINRKIPQAGSLLSGVYFPDRQPRAGGDVARLEYLVHAPTLSRVGLQKHMLTAHYLRVKVRIRTKGKYDLTKSHYLKIEMPTD